MDRRKLFALWPIAAVLVLMIVVSAVCVYDLNHPEEILWDYPPGLVYEGQRYGTARKPPNYNPDTLEVVAVIESSVEGYELATENNQSNFGCVGCEICISERNPEYIFIRHTTHDANTSAYKLSSN